MLRCLVSFLAACFAKEAAASRGKSLAVLDVAERTVAHGASAADLSGGVGLRLHQDPLIDIGISADITFGIFGNLLFRTVTPDIFVTRATSQTAVKGAIERASAAYVSAAVRGASVSLSLFTADAESQLVKVEFVQAFHTSRDSQGFARRARADRGMQLVAGICGALPALGFNFCAPPVTSFPEISGDRREASLMEEASHEVAPRVTEPICYGNVSLKPNGPPPTLVRNSKWQEAVAVSIAFAASVSRLQVSTLMAIEGDSVRVDFWLSGSCTDVRAAAVRRVLRTDIAFAVEWHMNAWRVGNEEANEFPVYGRMALQVPSPRTFADSESVRKSVRKAVRDVATKPDPEVTLSVVSTNVSLAAMSNLPDSVRVGFQVAFGSPRDRQVFADDFAIDGGAMLSSAINKEVRACEGRCRLPGQRPTAVLARKFGRSFGTAVTFFPQSQRLATDPQLQDAMAMAVSELASVPLEEVGILTMVSYGWRVNVQFWSTSNDATLRQAAVQRMGNVGQTNFWRCSLAQLDKLHDQAQSTGPASLAQALRTSTRRPAMSQPSGTMLVYAFAPERYLTEAARRAAAETIADVASVPRSQVGVSVSVLSPVLASIDFWVISTNATLRQAAVERVNEEWDAGDFERFTRAVSGDFPGPVFMVGGGTVFKQVDRFRC